MHCVKHAEAQWIQQWTVSSAALVGEVDLLTSKDHVSCCSRQAVEQGLPGIDSSKFAVMRTSRGVSTSPCDGKRAWRSAPSMGLRLQLSQSRHRTLNDLLLLVYSVMLLAMWLVKKHVVLSSGPAPSEMLSEVCESVLDETYEAE